ncbi:MAG: hypothetical protein A3C35_05620 [Omnitrophica bacterium RIFCSPHIGHO2_02_FULL_46_11]|nr:MAG: hypothetical protein A3A81_04335 [Omnitrophica bacterium RIFCSPLOWO2_01_FULL_45_10b]OGW86112.1 MAG: hypothetical protein A3C35_05620 [Omnitrophica bacterium RIFCSPHIGHO2_02_FULL_46_11]
MTLEHKNVQDGKYHVFPKGFLWGAATSSHQVEGDNIHNDWWEWEQTGKVKESSGKACEHWTRFHEDFKLAKSLHHNSHRFSIEWSRIEPHEGEFSEAAISHYRQMIQSLRSVGLEPIITLHHFTLPLWLAKEGGWLSNRSPQLFGRYAQKVAESLGEGIRYWMTINEPEVYIFKSYLTGEWPPGEKAPEKVYKVASHLLKAHVFAYDAIQDTFQKLNRPPTQVGIAKHVAVFSPCSSSLWDRISVWLRNLMFNHLFIKALIKGRIFYPGFFRIQLPRMKTLDFIGLNYYTRDFVANKGFRTPGVFGDVCTSKHHSDVGKKNFLSWEIYPKGLFLLVKDFSRYHLPILISENGICTEHDEERWQFIHDHLKHLAKAIEEGAPVIGYLYWSLLDNFEWAEGFAPQFGLVEVDYKTQGRKIRPSAKAYAQVCKTGLLLKED